jgi:hypothetical protein
MTREEIITMARQAGFDPHDMSADFTCNLDNIEAFAKLVAKAEREACADFLMGLHEAQSNNGNHNYYHFASNAIKELRGQE